MSAPTDHNPEALLGRWWCDHTATDEEDDQLTAKERLAITAPFGRTWPGIAPPPATDSDADEMADQYARNFLAGNPHARLGLVTASRSADTLAAVGWEGPANYDNDTARFGAVIRDWEQRFGVRAVGVGPSTLHLSVASPPTTPEHALAVAAEHFAFCPDNIWQGEYRDLRSYAEGLIDLNCWTFWWD